MFKIKITTGYKLNFDPLSNIEVAKYRQFFKKKAFVRILSGTISFAVSIIFLMLFNFVDDSIVFGIPWGVTIAIALFLFYRGTLFAKVRKDCENELDKRVEINSSAFAKLQLLGLLYTDKDGKTRREKYYKLKKKKGKTSS